MFNLFVCFLFLFLQTHINTPYWHKVYSLSECSLLVSYILWVWTGVCVCVCVCIHASYHTQNFHGPKNVCALPVNLFLSYIQFPLGQPPIF